MVGGLQATLGMHRMPNHRFYTVPLLSTLLPIVIFCQSVEPAPEPYASRIFGIIPNYRTFPSLTNYKPLTAKEKFKIANQDVSDRGTFVLAAAFAGEGMLTKSSPSFGHGVEGYSQYFVTSLEDPVAGLLIGVPKAKICIYEFAFNQVENGKLLFRAPV